MSSNLDKQLRRSIGDDIAYIALIRANAAGGGGGGAIGPLGAVQFSDGAGAFLADDSNFHWDNAANRLGLGNNTPSATLDITGSFNQVSGIFTLLGNSASSISTTATNNLSINAGDDLLLDAIDSISVGAATATTIQIGRIGATTTINGNLIFDVGTFSIVANGSSSITTSAGSLTLDAATALNLGNTTATSVVVGHAGITTTITGGLTQLTGAFSLTGNATSSLSTTVGSLTLDAATALSFGAITATSVAIGHAGIVTTLTGGFTQLTGAFSLTGNAASSLSTTVGSLTLDATTILSLGTTTATSIALGHAGITTTITGGLTQLTGAFSLTGNAASVLTTTAGALTITSAAALNLGTATTTSIAVGRAGITTTITGGLTQLTGTFSLTGNGVSSITTTSGNTTIDSAATLNLGASNATSVIINRSSGGGSTTIRGTNVNINPSTGAINLSAITALNVQINSISRLTIDNAGMATITAQCQVISAFPTDYVANITNNADTITANGLALTAGSSTTGGASFLTIGTPLGTTVLDIVQADATSASILPGTDNTGNIGSNALRWALVRATVVTTGDLELKDEKKNAHWIIKEENTRIIAYNNITKETFELMMKKVKD
jgi:hypothetical protein